MAMSHVEEILHQLNGGDLDGNDEPLRVYLTCYQVLRAYDDPRAGGILDGAYGLLQQRAAKIQSRDLQESFVDNVATHREIVAAWRAKRPGLLPKPGP
jgi:hypothetical protein